MNLHDIIAAIRNGLIVSCQALDDEPLYSPAGGIMPMLAKAAQEGGAAAIRANSVRDIIEIKQAVQLSVIGIIKKQYPPYEPYITATMEEVNQLVDAGTNIIALDCTSRKRADGKTIETFIGEILDKYPNQLLMADISTFDEGIAAAKAGAHLVSTTLNGYTAYTQDSSRDPNYELVEQLAKECEVPVIAEGRLLYPWQAQRMLGLGAWSVVVGGAITRPKEITARFAEVLSSRCPAVQCGGTAFEPPVC